MKLKAPTILGIESSCDDTSIAVVRNSSVLYVAHVSSAKEAEKYSGIMPEIATQVHYDNIVEMLFKIPNLENIDAVAVTYGPGLVGSLSIGVAVAKCAAIILNKPIYGVNHLIAHMFAAGEGSSSFFKDIDTLSLVVSGAHSSLFTYNKFTVERMGETLDDAPGEVFDKIGRELGLSYPGGPYIDALASLYSGDTIELPVAKIKKKSYDFSFSGLKTSVMRKIDQTKAKNTGENFGLSKHEKMRLSASVQKYISEALIRKTVKCALENLNSRIVVSGGVASNSYLRREFTRRCAKNKIDIFFPEKKLCTDNGVMVALLGEELLNSSIEPSGLLFDVEPTLDVETPFFRQSVRGK